MKLIFKKNLKFTKKRSKFASADNLCRSAGTNILCSIYKNRPYQPLQTQITVHLKNYFEKSCFVLFLKNVDDKKHEKLHSMQIVN